VEVIGAILNTAVALISEYVAATYDLAGAHDVAAKVKVTRAVTGSMVNDYIVPSSRECRVITRLCRSTQGRNRLFPTSGYRSDLIVGPLMARVATKAATDDVTVKEGQRIDSLDYSARYTWR